MKKMKLKEIMLYFSQVVAILAIIGWCVTFFIMINRTAGEDHELYLKWTVVWQITVALFALIGSVLNSSVRNDKISKIENTAVAIKKELPGS